MQTATVQLDSLPNATVEVQHDPVNGVIYTNVHLGAGKWFGYAFAATELATETPATEEPE